MRRLLQNLGLEQGAFLVSDGGLLPPAGRRGQPIGRPNEGKRMNVAKNTPQGRLAELLGTSDIPVDVMATFGGLGFLWGHARAKCGKAATWGLAMIVCGLVLLSKNGCAFTAPITPRIPTHFSAAESSPAVEILKSVQLACTSEAGRLVPGRYVTIHWDKVQRDCMGTTTYRYNEPRKHGLLATIPPHIQVLPPSLPNILP